MAEALSFNFATAARSSGSRGTSTGNISSAMRRSSEWIGCWRASVTVDHIQRQIDERVRAASPSDRMRLHVEMYRLAFTQVWAAADRAGAMTPLEEARFVLRRLYPDLEGPRLEAIMSDLAVRLGDGTRSGFPRPPRGREV